MSLFAFSLVKNNTKRNTSKKWQRASMLVAAFVVMGSLVAPVAFAAPKDYAWSQLTVSEQDGNWEAFASSANGNILVGVENGGYIYVSTDGGATWDQRTSAGNEGWYTVAVSASGKRMVAAERIGTGGQLYTSTDYGVTWTERTTAGARNWQSVASSNDGMTLAATDGTNAYVSQDGGANWAEYVVATPHSWRRIAMSADGTKLMAVSTSSTGYGDGYIYTSTDGGQTWLERTGAGANRFYSVALSADGMRAIVGVDNGGSVYTTTDGGVTWLERTGAGMGSWRSVASSASGNKLIAADYNGFVYRSNDGGVTWQEQTDLGNRWWVGVGSSASGSRIAAVAYDDTIYGLHRGVEAGAPVTDFDLSGLVLGASVPSAINQASIRAISGTCSYLDSLSVSGFDGTSLDDSNTNLTIIGGVAYNLSCTTVGGSAQVEVVLGQHYTDLSKFQVLKEVGGTLQEVTSEVTLENRDVDGEMKTVLSYSLTDGGAFDEDGVANGIIVDPIYVGEVLGATATTPATTNPSTTAGTLANTGTNTVAIMAGALLMIVTSIVVSLKSLKGTKRMGRI